MPLTCPRSMEEVRVHAIEPDSVEQNRQKTIALMNKLEPHLSTSRSGYLFGVERACALDAHLVVFIARMLDIGRMDIVPETFQTYARKAMKGQEWMAVQGAGTTKPTSIRE
jgi:hypothetical protein